MIPLNRFLLRRRKRRYGLKIQSFCKMYTLLFLIGCLTLLPQGLTQHNDELYIVKPTPALQLGKEELTTVLLVNNNDNHGRYVLRPEVGLLTSTARTFIQEGVTTEYATQVVGTTLDNGRVYAQYLKKSSRVLYNSAVSVPSVVTSWVGESLQSDAGFLPQSHNDLFDADQPDWRAIDDRLLGDVGKHPDVFVGNTDYVGSRKTSITLSSNKSDELNSDLVTLSSVNYTTTSKSDYNFLTQFGALDENARKVAANKVLPIGDLPTFTIKQNYEPTANNDADELYEADVSEEAFGRNPKLIYKNMMLNRARNENDAQVSISHMSLILTSRHLATITYYGFADFTTLVGDSVIVFSPSTSSLNVNNKAHVTSIKGEATLGAILPQVVSEIPITIAQDIIEPTIGKQTSEDTFTTTMQDDALLGTILASTEASLNKNTQMEYENNKSSSLLETSEVVVHQTQIMISSTQSTTLAPPTMLSRPSEEDILRIYNALVNAEKDKKIQQESMSTTMETMEASLESKKHLDTSNVQIFGGATTIFFEDDPFENFVEPAKASVSLDSTRSSQDNFIFNSDNFTLSESSEDPDEEFPVESTEEPIPSEATTDEPLTSSEIVTESIVSELITTTESDIKESLQDTNNSSNVLPNILVKEINPNDDEMSSNCISTSQVFLTQLPKTVTHFDTKLTTINDSLKTEISEKIEPTFEIKEATKYYCIQTIKIESNQIESPSVTVLLRDEEDVPDVTTSSAVEVTDINEDDNEGTEPNIFETKSQQTSIEEKGIDESSGNDSIDGDEVKIIKHEEEDEASGHQDEDDEDEEIELIYKSLYTTYTYLTTFFQDESTSISSHTEVVTNVITSTIGISVTEKSPDTNLNANVYENEINPTSTLESTQIETTKRFVVPSEVESFIRTDADEKVRHEQEFDSAIMNRALESSESSETLATFFTTYTYYTTIFAEGDTDIMSHTEIVTNIKKSIASTTTEADKIMFSVSSHQITQNNENRVSAVLDRDNILSSNQTYMSENFLTSNSVVTLQINSQVSSPVIPDLGELSAITLITDVRSSSSPGNKEIINNFDTKQIANDKFQQQLIFEDQISSESNTDTDEIIPSATLLLQTSFTTFTYYTTMYSGDKTNVISRLETMTNTATETLQPSKTIHLEDASAPITYFTTFTYWTKLSREGQITTLSREETVSNVITPTLVQQKMQSQIENSDGNTSEIPVETISTKNVLITDEKAIHVSKEKNVSDKLMIQSLSEVSNKSLAINLLEPTTYYTTYTYYTTSYETDKTITDSRFETVTNIITPTVALTYSDNNPGTQKESASSLILPQTESSNIGQTSSELVLYDFKKIIDADGISTIFFTTEIRPSINSDGMVTEVISSSSSLQINKEKQILQPTTTVESSESSLGSDGQPQKQYKTGLVRLIEGTRIANRTTTLYQSKVIGTIIDQRYAQIIESTSSFIFEETKSAYEKVSPNTIILPSTSSDVKIQATDVASPSNSGSTNVEGSIVDAIIEHAVEITTTKPNVEEDEENYNKSDEKLRFPFQTKKSGFISPLKPFTNRSRPQFAPKKNSSATIITRSDFTPTITATPALKTSSRFSSARKGSAVISSSNAASFASSSRRFGRPNKSSAVSTGLQATSAIASSGSSRNRFASTSSVRGAFASSSRRLGNSATTSRPSFSRPSLFSSGFPGNSRLRVRPTASSSLEEVSSSTDISTTIPLNSQEDGAGDSTAQDEVDEEDDTTESNRRQNNPLLRLRRPLSRPQGFTNARPQQNSPNNAVSLRRNPLITRGRNINSGTLSTTTTTTTVKPKPRTFQPPLTSQNRVRPTNSLFPPRNIFGVQKPEATTEENKDLSEEDANENNDDSEYEDEDDDEESEGDEDDESSRRRRSNNKIELKSKQTSRGKREADSALHNRSNFRNRFRRPKVASYSQTEPKSYEDDVSESKELTTTGVPSTTSTKKGRSRFGVRYSGHSSTTAASTTVAVSSNHKAIRPTRPSNNNGGRAQFTLREKDSSVMSTTQKGLANGKRPAFRRPQPASNSPSRRLPSSTSPSSPSGKRRIKSFTNNDSATTSRNSVTSRNRSSSTTSGRSRTSGASRDSNIGGRSRSRNNHNNNNNEPLAIDNSGTITVTHIIPAEVTIPIVNGKITEYKNVVTGKTSTEVLGPQQYTTSIGANGLPHLALTREDSSVNYNGATEVTQYILHETPTTTITFTPTTIRGRKTSFSHVLPSTAYSVEQVISTVQAQISANAPLANILLSQLLLGNVGLPAANPLLGALGGALTQNAGLGTSVGPLSPATPVTEYKTHASTYVTTVFEGQSTVLPITFQGKKILTTIFDTTAQTITATEFITDTIVSTPSIMAQPQPVVNSLLLQQLLLQQHLQQQQLQQQTSDSSKPLSTILNSVPPQFLLGGDNLQELEASNNIRGSGHDDFLKEEDYAAESSVDFDDIALQAQAQTHKTGRKKTRKNSKNHKRKQNNNSESPSFVESSIITLYVSGRRPGEFSTVLSTVQVHPDSTQYKRHAHTIDSLNDFFNDGSEYLSEYLALPPEIVLLDDKDNKENEVSYDSSTASATQSLEDIVGDVSLWYTAQTMATNTVKFTKSATEIINQKSIYEVFEGLRYNTDSSNHVNLNQNFFA